MAAGRQVEEVEIDTALHTSAAPNLPSPMGRFVLMYLLGSILLAAAMGLSYRVQAKSRLDKLLQESRLSLRLQQETIGLELANVVADVKFLSDSRVFQTFLDSGDEGERAKIALGYLNFSRYHPAYDQIRLLNEEGTEVIRINFNNGNPSIIPPDQLQSKGTRYYVSDTLRLGRGEMYISPLDLNVEGDAIERPLKPTIRFCAPVFDTAGRKRGIVMVNYLAVRLFKSIHKLAAASGGRPMLLNSDGYWLCGPNAGQEWGFMFPDKKGVSFAKSYPAAWQRIRREPRGDVTDKAGCFVFTTIYPAGRDLISSTGSPEVQGESARMLQAESYYWKLICFVPAEWLQAESRLLALRLAGLSALLLVLLGVASWFIAQASAQRSVYRRRMQHLALHDPLTGLPNRLLFMDRLEHSLRESQRYGRSCAVLFFDLDGFKEVNDRFGHAVGDEILKSAAERVSAALRSSDTAARVGGDEFAILLTSIERDQQAGAVAQKLIEVLARPFSVRENEARIGASIGIALYPRDGDDAALLLSKADAAMYQAKRGGKGRYCAFSELTNAPQALRE